MKKAAVNMTWMETIDGEVDYAHDATHQLTDADYDYATDEGYVYDENGNRVTANGDTYVTGPNNQLLSDGTYRYVYDAEGNRTLKYIDVDEDEVFDSGDTDATTYDWDHRNRLETVTHYDDYTDYAAEESDQSVDYTYDYANRLIARTLDPDGSSGATAVEQSVYSYDGSQIALQFDKTGTGDLAATDLSHRYLWNPQAIDQLFADEQVHYDGGFVTDELLWTLTDHLNSVRDLATYNSGTDITTVATHRVFDAFGNQTSSTGSEECLFGYTGKLFDEATQLQNNWQRWYDATVGRWLSEDAIWDGTNLTRYVGNSPTTNTDPLGLCKEDNVIYVSTVGPWSDPNEPGCELPPYWIRPEDIFPGEPLPPSIGEGPYFTPSFPGIIGPGSPGWDRPGIAPPDLSLPPTRPVYPELLIPGTSYYWQIPPWLWDLVKPYTPHPWITPEPGPPPLWTPYFPNDGGSTGPNLPEGIRVPLDSLFRWPSNSRIDGYLDIEIDPGSGLGGSIGIEIVPPHGHRFLKPYKPFNPLDIGTYPGVR